MVENAPLKLRETPPLAIQANNRALTLISESKWEAALALHKRAHLLDPVNDRFALNYAAALINEGYAAEAIEIIDKFPHIDNGFIRMLKGWVYLNAGRPLDAAEEFNEAITKEPESQEYVFDYATALLAGGDWKRGWRAYEFRKPERNYGLCPKWDGSRVHRLLVWTEQGQGDTFQFLRFIPWLSEQVDEIVLVTHTPIMPLIENYQKYSKIMDINTFKDEVNAHVSLLSLPYFYGCTPENIPDDPNLFAKSNTIGVLGAPDKLKVGLVWSGNEKFIRNRWRKCNLKHLIPLASNPELELFSLQCGEPAKEIHQEGASSFIVDLSGLIFNEWTASAAILQELDVLVTTDTGLAHLAGSMGVPVCLMLPFVADWRWMTGRNDTPWYKSVKLFRQPKFGDWNSVVKEVSLELDRMVNEKKNDEGMSKCHKIQ